MEFEFHITVKDLTMDEKEVFISVCNQEQVKPVMIVLDQGNYIHQPMITGIVHGTDYQQVNQEIERVATTFQNKGFTVVRTKVEIPAKEEKFFDQPLLKSSKPYFEWHGKVQVDEVDSLKSLCAGYGGHISRNSLHANGKVRFVTVREYESKESFYDRVGKIHTLLQANQIELMKEQYELCIYDSREDLDSGWI